MVVTNLVNKELFREMPLAPEDARAGIRDRLILRNIPLVLNIAKRYASRARNAGLAFDDIFGAGRIGLIEAVDMYDISRGFEFSTYATRKIDGYIKNCLRSEGRHPRSLYERYPNYGETSERLTQELVATPTAKELAEGLNLSEEESTDSYQMMALAYADSLHRRPFNDGRELYERVSDGSSLTAQPMRGFSYERVSILAVREAMNKLPELWRRVVELYYSEDGMSMEEVGKTVGCTKQHVSRVLKKAIKRLRICLEPALS